MLIREFGLTSYEKAAFKNSIATEGELVHFPGDYEDDPPCYNVIFQGRQERLAGLLGIITFEHLNPGLKLEEKTGLIKLDFSFGSVKYDDSSLRTDRQPDLQLIAGMHWVAEDYLKISTDAFAEYVLKFGVNATFNALDENQLIDHFHTLTELVNNMLEAGVLPRLDDNPTA